MLKKAIARVVKGDDLTVEEMEGAMEEVMTGDATDGHRSLASGLKSPHDQMIVPSEAS